MSQSKRIPFRVIILLIIAWGLWTVRIGQAYYAGEESAQIWVPAAVLNYERYGIEQIGLGIVTNTVPVDDLSELTYYHNHPPLIVWLPAIFSKFIGYHELGIRFVFPAAMMIASAAFYVLVRRLYNKDMAFWSLLFFSLSPMITYYETTYQHDPLGFMASLLFTAVFINWLRSPNTARFLALIFLAILAAYTAWTAVFFVGVVGIIGMIIATNRHRLGILILGAVTILSIIIVLTTYELIHAGSISTLIEIFFWRSSSATFRVGSRSFSTLEWFANAIVQMTIFSTASVMILSLIGVGSLKKQGAREASWLVLALFCASLLYQLVFRNASYIHSYYKGLFMPSLAILSAAAILYARRIRIRYLKPFIDVLLLGFFLQSILILWLLVATPYKDQLESIIDYINNETEAGIPIAVHFSETDIRTLAHERVIEFYTERDIVWLTSLDENTAEILIDCSQDITMFPESQIIGSDCVVLYFNE